MDFLSHVSMLDLKVKAAHVKKQRVRSFFGLTQQFDAVRVWQKQKPKFGGLEWPKNGL